MHVNLEQSAQKYKSARASNFGIYIGPKFSVCARPNEPARAAAFERPSVERLPRKFGYYFCHLIQS